MTAAGGNKWTTTRHTMCKAKALPAVLLSLESGLGHQPPDAFDEGSHTNEAVQPIPGGCQGVAEAFRVVVDEIGQDTIDDAPGLVRPRFLRFEMENGHDLCAMSYHKVRPPCFRERSVLF